MKTVAFYVQNVTANAYPFSVKDLYFYSYQEYLLALKEQGADAYFVTGADSYKGLGRFNNAWTIDAVSEVADFKHVNGITADIVFDKGSDRGGFIGTDITTVTDHRLRDVLDSKLKMYEQFGQFQPASVLCKDPESLMESYKQIKTDIVVVKNPTGHGGSQVYIGKKAELAIPSTETYPLLVQEFVDMSAGIPGLASGVHDVRLLMTGNRVIGATLREPAKGRLHANVSLGGTERLLSIAQIPKELQQMALKIDALLPDFPRYYAIDFACGPNGWVLIELNNKPGLFRQNNGPLAKSFMEALARYIVSLD